MNNIVLIVKGFFIGIGKVIPGVSGSLIAITLGIYDKLLEIVSNFFKNIKGNIKFLFFVCLGILLAIILSSNILIFLLNNYYVIFMLFFIGLILGGLPSIIKNSNLKLNKDIIYGFLSFILIISFYFIKTNSNNEIHNYSFIIYFFIGLLDAVTMIIPGISGTAIMMMLGCYKTVLNLFSNILKNLKDAFPFFMGVGVGIIVISKIINFCFKKYPSKTNYTILGFTLSSSIVLFIEVFTASGNITEYIIGLFLLIIGFKITISLEKHS